MPPAALKVEATPKGRRHSRSEPLESAIERPVPVTLVVWGLGFSADHKLLDVAVLAVVSGRPSQPRRPKAYDAPRHGPRPSTRREDGIYEYALRRPWRDGTIAIELSPMELIEKLCALVPKPKVHLIRYHGVFAPNHPWRKRIVPKIPEEEQEVGVGGWKPRGGLVGLGYVPWAQLLKRSFSVDVLRCERCGSKRILIEVVEPDAVREILGCLGLDFRGPRPESARGPPVCD